jgi:hypothetical protein
MKKQKLDNMVYYYEDAVENFEKVVNIIKELRDADSVDQDGLWSDWTASDEKTFIYGETQTFDFNQIKFMDEPHKSKMEFVYRSIMQSFYNVSKDYAKEVGDLDEPRLFPMFSIKKYNTGSAMGAHYDQLDGDKTLRYSLVMYLNDDYEGGEISFKLSEYEDHHQITSPNLDYDIALANNEIDFGVKPSAGSIIIFPSSAPYYHIAHMVKLGAKYMVPSHWIHNGMELNNE